MFHSPLVVVVVSCSSFVDRSLMVLVALLWLAGSTIRVVGENAHADGREVVAASAAAAMHMLHFILL